MKKVIFIAFVVLFLTPLSFVYAAQKNQTQNSNTSQVSNQSVITRSANSSSNNANANSNTNQAQDQDRVREQDRDGDCDGDGTLNYQDEEMDESINACKQYQNRNKWESGYNPRSENARLHMSVVAESVEELLRFGDELDDQTLGEQIREIAQKHGQSAEKIVENEDVLNQRSGVLKFLIGPDYAAVDEINRQMDQIRNQVRELNQIRTRLQNEGDQAELQNQIKILELQLNTFKNSLNAQEEVFSLFGWLAKLFQ